MRFHSAHGTNPDEPKAWFSIQGPQDESQVPPEIVALCKRRLDITSVALYHKDLNQGGTTPQLQVYSPLKD